jgi:hypothetical protein
MQITALPGRIGSIALALIAACSGSSGHVDEPDWETGRCGVVFHAIDEQTRAAAAQAFIDRNGSGWQVSEIDAFNGHLVRATRALDPDGEVVELDRAQAESLVMRAIRDNADLLGLSQDEISALVVVGAMYNTGAGPLQWMVELLGQAAIPGYQELDSQRRLRVVVDIAKDGLVMGVTNRSEIFPEIDICTTPMLAADDPRLFSEVLGTELYYSDIVGNPQVAGTVAQENIVVAAPVLYIKKAIRMNTPDRLLIRLAYRVDVAFDLLTWSFFVDPDNGALIEIRQNFVT